MSLEATALAYGYREREIGRGIALNLAGGEVLALLRQGLEGATRARQVEEIHGEFVAIDRAMDQLQTGDLCLILIDQVEEALAHIERRIAERNGARIAAE